MNIRFCSILRLFSGVGLFLWGLGTYPVAAQIGPTVDFDWRLEDRTFLDSDGKLQIPSVRINSTRDVWWGNVEVPILTEIAPTTFNVTLQATINPGGSPVISVVWRIQQLNEGPVIITGSGNPFQTSLPRGAYQVTLAVQDQNGMTAGITKTVTVKDLLIVAVGDSMTSGEGNPNVPQVWELHDRLGFDELKAGPKWQDTRDDGLGRYSLCHRSKFSWPVLLADEIEKREPHTSVTLLHLGCSGAEIEGAGGLLKSYLGVEPTRLGGGIVGGMEPQLRQVLRALCSDLPELVSPVLDPIGDCPVPSLMRRIDTLMMTIGINDIHFSDIIKDCVTQTLEGPIVGGTCAEDSTPAEFLTGISELGENSHVTAAKSTKYEALGAAIDSHLPNLAPHQVYISQYPDPFSDVNGDLCYDFDPDSPLDYPGYFPKARGIDALSQLGTLGIQWLDFFALPVLNDTVQFNTLVNTWHVVAGIADLSHRHGFCAGSNRWFRQGIESTLLQGPAAGLILLGDLIAETLEQHNSTGTIHPNHSGHRALKDLFLASFDSHRDVTSPAIVCGFSDGQWHNRDVSIGCSADDTSSGLLNRADARFALATNVPPGAETDNAATNSRVVCDSELNCGTAGPITGNKIDKKAPSIGIMSPGAADPYIINQAVTASYSCSDGGSGVATCAGVVASGASIDTTSVGTKTFTVTAADNVANASNLSVVYAVTYKICLAYDPDKISGGRAYVFKLQLCDYSGVNVSNVSTVVTATGVDGDPTKVVSIGAPNAGNTFLPAPGTAPGASYIYVLDTQNLTRTAHVLNFTVQGDPAPHSLPFLLK